MVKHRIWWRNNTSRVVWNSFQHLILCSVCNISSEEVKFENLKETIDALSQQSKGINSSMPTAVYYRGGYTTYLTSSWCTSLILLWFLLAVWVETGSDWVCSFPVIQAELGDNFIVLDDLPMYIVELYAAHWKLTCDALAEQVKWLSATYKSSV